jgi:hypothetical protein
LEKQMKRVLLIAAAALSLAAGGAQATVILGNQANFHNAFSGFNPTLIPDWDGYVAQRFTLSSTAVLTLAQFTAGVSHSFDEGTDIPNFLANWQVRAAAGSTPGSILASGSTAATHGAPFSGGGTLVDINSFALPSVTLGPGVYYFVLQGVSDTLAGTIQMSSSPGPLTFTTNGGTTWQDIDPSGLAPSLGWAIRLEGNIIGGGVPEPASWALMITGFGLTGAALRRRRALAFARA